MDVGVDVKGHCQVQMAGQRCMTLAILTMTRSLFWHLPRLPIVVFLVSLEDPDARFQNLSIRLKRHVRI